MRQQLGLAVVLSLMSGMASATALECQVVAADNNGYSSPCWGEDMHWKKYTTNINLRLTGLTGSVSQVIWNGSAVCHGSSCTTKTFRQPQGEVSYTAQILYQNGTWETLSVDASWFNPGLSEN